MGCDIHLYVERRDNGKWLTCDTWEKREDDDNTHVPYQKSFYHDRNYDLFAIFADVRNGRGFAGCKIGDGFNPIARPRGIPDDCCKEYRERAEAYGEDGHSHSWLTVAEIMAYDWTQVTAKEGCVTPSEWARWKIDGRPHSWSGGVAGNGVVHVKPEQMERAVRHFVGTRLWDMIRDDGPLTRQVSVHLGGAEREGSAEWACTAYTVVRWEIPYYDAGANFLGETLPRLWRLGKPDDVRIVFFFDN